MNGLICLQARRAAADAAAGAADTIARMRLEAAATVTESADRLVKVELIMDMKFNFSGRPNPLKDVLTTQFHGCGSYFVGEDDVWSCNTTLSKKNFIG